MNGLLTKCAALFLELLAVLLIVGAMTLIPVQADAGSLPVELVKSTA